MPTNNNRNRPNGCASAASDCHQHGFAWRTWIGSRRELSRLSAGKAVDAVSLFPITAVYTCDRKKLRQRNERQKNQAVGIVEILSER